MATVQASAHASAKDGAKSTLHLIETARSLASRFRERAEEAESARCIPAASITELQEAGLCRVYQSARYGGPELPMQTVLQIVTEIAKGCPSTAWVLAVLQIHEFLLGLFPEQAQDEVFGEDPDTLVAGVVQPRTSARRVDGGYLIEEGRWVFGSGCDHASWAIVGALVQEGDGPPEPTVMLVPPGEWRILDDWNVVGLSATGSKSLTVENALVPEHRTLRMGAAIAGEAGAGRTGLFRSAFVPMLALNVTGPAVGATHAAIEIFKNGIGKRPIPFTSEPQVAARQTFRQLAEAMTKRDVASLLLDRAAASVRAAADAGQQLDYPLRARVRVDSAYAVRQCVEAIETLFLASGGGVLQRSHPLQRLQRDVHAMALHGALVLEPNLELYGAIALGQASPSPFV